MPDTHVLVLIDKKKGVVMNILLLSLCFSYDIQSTTSSLLSILSENTQMRFRKGLYIPSFICVGTQEGAHTL